MIINLINIWNIRRLYLYLQRQSRQHYSFMNQFLKNQNVFVTAGPGQ